MGWVHWLSARAGLAVSLSLRIGFCGKISHIFELDWTFEIYLSQRPDKEDDRTFLIHPHYWKVLWFPYAYVIVVLRLMITIWCTYQPYWKTHISLFTIWPSETQLLFNDWNLGGMSSKDWGRRGKGQIWNSIPLKFKSSPYLPLLWTWARNLTSRWQNRQKWATQACPTVAQCPLTRRRVKAFTKQSSTTLTPPFPVELPLRFPSHKELRLRGFFPNSNDIWPNSWGIWPNSSDIWQNLQRIWPKSSKSFSRLLLLGWLPWVRWRQLSSTTLSQLFSLSKVLLRCSKVSKGILRCPKTNAFLISVLRFNCSLKVFLGRPSQCMVWSRIQRRVDGWQAVCCHRGWKGQGTFGSWNPLILDPSNLILDL